MTPNEQIASTELAPLTMGKYRIVACPRALADGRFAAQVSIASGHGSASTDRVMQFSEEFPTFEAAAHYAMNQGKAWVDRAASLQQTSTH